MKNKDDIEKKLDEINIDDIKKNPEKYIEINMIGENRMVTNFFIYSHKNTFKHKNKTYKINPKYTYLIPTSKGYFIPSAFYKEGQQKPRKFNNKNKGIPCNALTLLWDIRLYKLLVKPEDKQLNFILIILSILILIFSGITAYFYFGGQL